MYGADIAKNRPSITLPIIFVTRDTSYLERLQNKELRKGTKDKAAFTPVDY